MSSKLNMNEIARMICEFEGKKVELSIGQVKEVLSCLRKVFQVDPLGIGQCLLAYLGKAPKNK